MPDVILKYVVSLGINELTHGLVQLFVEALAEQGSLVKMGRMPTLDPSLFLFFADKLGQEFPFE